MAGVNPVAGAGHPANAGPVRIIETEADLAAYLEKLRKNGVKEIALDLEGDQGTIHYEYSIAILQCFDGTEALVIDVVKTGNCAALREFLTCPDISKVMFSCKNDLFMTQNTLGCTISPLRDIALAQKLLGKTVNISEHIGIDKTKKDKFQRANWLRRPLARDLVEYAINDVLHLIRVQNDLESELAEKGLLQQFLNTSKDMPNRDYRVDQYEQYKEKFPGYDRLKGEKRELAALLWAFREMLGEHYDCPVGYLIPKSAMNDIIRDKKLMLEMLQKELKGNRNRRIDGDTVSNLYKKAVERCKSTC